MRPWGRHRSPVLKNTGSSTGDTCPAGLDIQQQQADRSEEREVSLVLGQKKISVLYLYLKGKLLFLENESGFWGVGRCIHCNGLTSENKRRDRKRIKINPKASLFPWDSLEALKAGQRSVLWEGEIRQRLKGAPTWTSAECSPNGRSVHCLGLSSSLWLMVRELILVLCQARADEFRFPVLGVPRGRQRSESPFSLKIATAICIQLF